MMSILLPVHVRYQMINLRTRMVSGCIYNQSAVQFLDRIAKLA